MRDDTDAALYTDATTPVDAVAPDTRQPDARLPDPACDYVIDLRRDPVETPLEIAFTHGTVQGKELRVSGEVQQMYLGPDGAGVFGQESPEHVDPFEMLRFTWDIPVVDVAYSLTGGRDGNATGTLSLDYYYDDSGIRGDQPALDDTGYIAVDAGGPITSLGFRGVFPDSIRIGSLLYSVCLD